MVSRSMLNMQSAASKRKRNDTGKPKSLPGSQQAIKDEELTVPWVTMPGTERDIIIDRLRKEVVPLIFVEPPKEPEEPAPVEPADTSQASKKRKPKQRVKAFTSQVEAPLQQKMRSLLTFGVNETTRALEKDTVSLLFICRDVKPIRVVDHLATCARVHQVPFVVLPKATASLGQAFGMQRMACLGIRRPSTPTAQQGAEANEEEERLARLKSFCDLILSKEALLNR